MRYDKLPQRKKSPPIQYIPTSFWIRLHKLVPLSRLHRLRVRPADIILVRLRHTGLLAPALDDAPPALLLREILVNRHRGQAMVEPEDAVLQPLPRVEEGEWLERFPRFAEDGAGLCVAQEVGEGRVQAVGVGVGLAGGRAVAGVERGRRVVGGGRGGEREDL